MNVEYARVNVGYVRVNAEYVRINKGSEVRKTETAVFAVTGSRSFHKLELSKALLRFVEFDFTYFWEQCIEAGRNARKTGRISQNLKNMAMNALVKCHPYVEACAATEFADVVLDCIIAYICHSEGIGLEELWARCISPKAFTKRLFSTVSANIRPAGE